MKNLEKEVNQVSVKVETLMNKAFFECYKMGVKDEEFYDVILDNVLNKVKKHLSKEELELGLSVLLLDDFFDKLEAFNNDIEKFGFSEEK